MGYIYNADVYCNDCGDQIRKQLTKAAFDGTGESVPLDWMDHSSYDSDNFPKDADVEHEESDSPQHCAKCGEFLNNPLTSAGYKYVQEQLNETGMMSIYQGNVSIALKEWATWYDFTYWTAEDCANDGRHSKPGWYSNEAY